MFKRVDRLDLSKSGLGWEFAVITGSGLLMVVNRAKSWKQDARPEPKEGLSVRMTRFRPVGGQSGVRYDCYQLEDVAKLFQFNVRSSDREYWNLVRKFLDWLGAPYLKGQAWARTAYKFLRELHHTAQAKEWEDVLDDGIARWAAGELRREADKQSCSDNFRVARVGNTSQMRRYRRAKARGCCGSSDWEAVGPDGKVYAIGFNYGH